MQVTNGDIWQARGPLQEVLAVKWPIKTAYWLGKLGQEIDRHYGLLDQMRVKLVQQYGTEGNGQFTISPESPEWVQFATEMNELMMIQVEIPYERIILPPRIDKDESKAPEFLPATLMALDPFVEVT